MLVNDPSAIKFAVMDCIIISTIMNLFNMLVPSRCGISYLNFSPQRAVFALSWKQSFFLIRITHLMLMQKSFSEVNDTSQFRNPKSSKKVFLLSNYAMPQKSSIYVLCLLSVFFEKQKYKKLACTSKRLKQNFCKSHGT